MRESNSGSAVLLVALCCACGSTRGDGGKEPPAAPLNSCGVGITVETFAIDSIDLGENDWQTLGYDLDGKTTTKDSVDVCTLQSGTPRSNQIDGDRGMDNAFGESFVPALEGLFQDPAPSAPMTSAIASGRFTLQIQVVHLDDTPNQTCDSIEAQIFTSDRYDAATVPGFDETTDWPVMSESLVDPNAIAGGASARFNDGYVQTGTVVLGARGGVTVPLHLVLENGNAFDLRVHQAIITFDHVNAREATNGVLAGVLDPQEVVLAANAFPYPKACCVTSCGESWGPMFRSWSDIRLDRTNPPSIECNAISFAIGFHAKTVANPTRVAAPLPARPPQCP